MKKSQNQRILYIVISLLIAIINNSSFAQKSISDSLKARFINYQSNHLQEKISLHVDKDLYLVSEIVWFKAYLVDDFFTRPSLISKVAYIELIDQTNSSVLQAVIPIKIGFGNGSFQLPNQLNSGVYTIRAYTNWMKNDGPESFYSKAITIINPNAPIIVFGDDRMIDTELYFFPEGGDLINNIENKVTFKISKNDKSQWPINGLIVNNLKDTLAEFSNKSGDLNNFSFVPQLGKNYKAIIKLQNGKILEKNLPNVIAEGTVLKLATKENNEIELTLQATLNFEKQEVYLLIDTKGVFKTIITGKIFNGKLRFNFNKNILADGISHFTVFDSQLKPLCQRSYFKYPEKKLNVNLNLEKTEYEIREKIKINIISNDHENKIKSANLSMAVYLVDSLQKTDETTILNSLLLPKNFDKIITENKSVEDKRKIESSVNESIIFDNKSPFLWSDIQDNTGSQKNFLPEYAGQIITGRITNAINNKPIINENSFLSRPSKNTEFYNSTSDSLGNVKFELRNTFGKNEFIFHTEKKDSTIIFELFSPYSNQYSKHESGNFTNIKFPKNDLEKHIKYSEIQTKFNLKHTNIFDRPQTDSIPFYFKPDYTYLLDNYVRFTTLEEVLKEYVPAVGVKKREGNYQLQVVDKLSTGYFDGNPLVLLDGLALFDLNKLMKYDPLKIKKLEVVSGKYFLGSMTFDGIINFITYQGDLLEYELEPNTTVVDLDGFQLQREFYSPNYNSKIQKESRIPDFRNLLYWNPEITTVNGTNNLEFYSSDIPGTYAIVVHGISNDGLVGTQIKYLTVKAALK